MVSNGMSSRRTTLKRPIVCKSKPKGNCGDCTLNITSPTLPIPAGTIQLWGILIDCAIDPTVTQFNIEIKGGFIPVAPVPPITVNIGINVNLQTPAAAGDYTLKIAAGNSDKCIFLFEEAFPVV